MFIPVNFKKMLANSRVLVFFLLSKSIKLHSVRLFGSDNNEYEATLEVTESSVKQVIITALTSFLNLQSFCRQISDTVLNLSSLVHLPGVGKVVRLL